MRYKHTVFIALALGFIVWVWMPMSAQASTLYDKIGMLDAKHSDLKSVVIYDEVYNIGRDTKVCRFNPDVDNTHPKKCEEVSLEVLMPGMTLGYTVIYTGTSQSGQIKEIWILPSESEATIHSEADEKER